MVGSPEAHYHDDNTDAGEASESAAARAGRKAGLMKRDSLYHDTSMGQAKLQFPNLKLEKGLSGLRLLRLVRPGNAESSCHGYYHDDFTQKTGTQYAYIAWHMGLRVSGCLLPGIADVSP